MTDSNLKKWYVVRAVSGQENKVKAYIENEISRLEMGDYVSQVLVPTEKVVTVKERIKIGIFSWVYVMIEANLIGEIPHIKGITSVIGF
jgi:transcriptional antiterminator NusG